MSRSAAAKASPPWKSICAPARATSSENVACNVLLTATTCIASEMFTTTCVSSPCECASQ